MEKKQYPFIKEFMLISQTPMIHFQFEQNGATLRATEVKPKLDAFLTEKAKQIGVDISQWLIHDTKALNYKMRIIAEGASTSDCNIGNYKFYFGNRGESKKDVVFQNAKLQIICFLDELRDLICRTIK